MHPTTHLILYQRVNAVQVVIAILDVELLIMQVEYKSSRDFRDRINRGDPTVDDFQALNSYLLGDTERADVHLGGDLSIKPNRVRILKARGSIGLVG